MYRWFRKFYKISNESTLLPCITHRSWLFWLNSPDIMEFLSWKRFILMWSILQSVFQRKRVLRSSWLLNEHNLSCKIVKKRILSAVCKLTIKTPPHSAVYIRMWCIKSINGWLTRRQIQLLLARFCKVNLSNTKTRLDFFILASPLDKGMQPINCKRVNWLIYCDQEPLWLLTHRRWLQFFGCTYNSMYDFFHS